MPSPFPGMDPFLEHPKHFPDLHDKLITHTSEALQAKLPDPYFAVIRERLWVETSWRYIEPDVDLLHAQRSGHETHETSGNGEVAVAVEVRTRSRPLLVQRRDDEIVERSIDIRTREPDGSERVVTSIEVLSLANKTPGSKGWDAYAQKQREVQQGGIHLVEIDLLRGGTHATLVPREEWLRRQGGPFEYHVSVYRAHRPQEGCGYLWRLPELLPEIAVPLLPRHGEVALDLQAVFTRCYDAGPYRRRVRYDDPAQVLPPLDAEQAAWVQECLRASGLMRTER